MRIPCTARRLGLVLIGATLLPTATAAQARHQVRSPDGRNEVTVGSREGRLYYSVRRDGRPVLLPSGLGFEFRGAA
ncbi:MAG: glycoside hydrolase family 97 N-terminal domain-containing protein, partial [Gemmatimonadota bacterium]|nr:glycoside hydrolase family 97 N-terminal domain-containing protein [Gemmatimonadota bacterium]